ncbi:hypothetical protein niasHT_020895 [Heterodera trifolii]|uniref:Uncharacterized protein n=1 Tax=Heterodera trifolii TaxID=157864 RepID=A0ABD2KS06_9BILA
MFRLLLICSIAIYCSTAEDPKWEVVHNDRCHNCTADNLIYYKLIGYVGPLQCLKKGYDLNRPLQWPNWPGPIQQNRDNDWLTWWLNLAFFVATFIWLVALTVCTGIGFKRLKNVTTAAFRPVPLARISAPFDAAGSF